MPDLDEVMHCYCCGFPMTVNMLYTRFVYCHRDVPRPGRRRARRPPHQPMRSMQDGGGQPAGPAKRKRGNCGQKRSGSGRRGAALPAAVQATAEPSAHSIYRQQPLPLALSGLWAAAAAARCEACGTAATPPPLGQHCRSSGGGDERTRGARRRHHWGGGGCGDERTCLLFTCTRELPAAAS